MTTDLPSDLDLPAAGCFPVPRAARPARRAADEPAPRTGCLGRAHKSVHAFALAAGFLVLLGAQRAAAQPLAPSLDAGMPSEGFIAYDGGAPEEAADADVPELPEEAILAAGEEGDVVVTEEAGPVEGYHATPDMIVTALRRKTALQDTPISITAVSGETLRERGATDIRDVATATPNLQLTTAGNGSGGGNFAQVFIRGVGQPDFIITKDPAVGIYVDGVYLARAPGSLLELLDVERIEVLRGPQGTLFGKNTAGGAISLVTKQPEAGHNGSAELILGSYGRRDISGSFGTTLVDSRLFLRVTGLSRHRDGYYERLTDGPIEHRTADGNSTNVHTGRASLRWTATNDLDVVFSADGTLQRQTGTDYQAVGIYESRNTELYNRVVLAPQNQRYDAQWIAPRPWTTYSTSPSYNNTDVWGVSGTISWELDVLQLKSITAYRAVRAASKTDGDGTPFDIVASNGIEVKQRQVSQELQATGSAFAQRLSWVGGLWYFQEHAEDSQSSRQLVGLYEDLEAAPPRSIYPPGGMASQCPMDGSGPSTCLGGMGNPANRTYDQTRLGQRDLVGRSYAAFGQATGRIVGELALTLGLRFSREAKDFRYYETRPLQNNLVSFDNVEEHAAWNVFTPKVSLEYRFIPELMAYASYARGFKAGGVNGRPTRPDLFTSFDPETLSTYEVGAKSDWFDRKLRINLAAFYSQYHDIQVTRSTTDETGAFVRLEDNAGDGDIRGFELETTAVPVRGLNLSVGVGYTNFKFTSLLPQMAPPGTPLLTLDTELPFTPLVVVNASAAYRIPLGDAGFLTPRVDLNYSSSYYIDIDNTEAVEQDPYTQLNARLAYLPESTRWEVYFAASNLTNETVIGSGVAAPANGSQVVSYLPPRMFYGGMRFNFD